MQDDDLSMAMNQTEEYQVRLSFWRVFYFPANLLYWVIIALSGGFVFGLILVLK